MSVKNKPNTICTICDAQHCGRLFKYCLSCANEMLLIIKNRNPKMVKDVVCGYKGVLEEKRKEFKSFLDSIHSQDDTMADFLEPVDEY